MSSTDNPKGLKVAMLLNGAISNDHRVIKLIQTISTKHAIDLFCLEDDLDDEKLFFSKNVRVIKSSRKVNLKTQLIRHSFFCYEFNFFFDKVMRSRIAYDYIWANDLPTLLPAFKLKIALKAKLIYDSHEIYVETLNQFFPQKTSTIKAFLFSRMVKFMKWHGRKIEKKLIKEVDEFVTVNDSLLDFFKKEYTFERGHVIMNIPSYSGELVKPFDFRKKFNFESKDLILLYQGNLNQGRGLEKLIEATVYFPDNWKLILIGEGTLKAELQKKCNEENVKFMSFVPIHQLPNYTSGADIGINFLESINLSKKMASPNKLFEYIHAGVPILATEGVENRKIIEKYSVGLLCDLNISSILSSIQSMDRVSLKEFSKNCQLARLELRWQNQEEEIMDLFTD